MPEEVDFSPKTVIFETALEFLDQKCTFGTLWEEN